MTNSRVKGRGAEYDVARILDIELGLRFKRDVEQYRQADRGDLLCVDMDFPAVIEVKRFAKGVQAKPAWWDQVTKAAKAANKWPLLVYRYDRQDWRWRLPASVLIELGKPVHYLGANLYSELDWNYAVEMDTRTAMTLIRELLAHEASKTSDPKNRLIVNSQS